MRGRFVGEEEDPAVGEVGYPRWGGEVEGLRLLFARVLGGRFEVEGYARGAGEEGLFVGEGGVGGCGGGCEHDPAAEV